MSSNKNNQWDYRKETGEGVSTRKLKFPMKFEQLPIYKAIDEILWNDWDPIGVNDCAPRDEYQSYLPEIFRLKIEGGNAEVIANKLLYFEMERMGLDGDIKHCRTIAAKILAV